VHVAENRSISNGTGGCIKPDPKKPRDRIMTPFPVTITPL
jgi:hypothetical protein